MSTLHALYFPPPNFHNTTLLVHTSSVLPLSTPQLRLRVPKHTRYGSVWPPPPFFPRQTGVPSATPSTAELDSQQCFLTSFLDSTQALVCLSDNQVAPYAPGDLEALSTTEQALIPLLCSTLHTVSNIVQAVQELRQDFSYLRVQMTNAS